MNPIDNTPRSQTESISLEFDLQHPPAKVWRALTDPALLKEWLLPLVHGADFRLEPGAVFLLQAPPQPGWDGIVNCRLREIEAPRQLSWEWTVGEIDTVVTFTLTPAREGTATRLSLVHSGFKPGQQQNFAGARYGWKMMGARLIDLLAGLA